VRWLPFLAPMAEGDFPMTTKINDDSIFDDRISQVID
jgi:hypothetical protein